MEAKEIEAMKSNIAMLETIKKNLTNITDKYREYNLNNQNEHLSKDVKKMLYKISDLEFEVSLLIADAGLSLLIK